MEQAKQLGLISIQHDENRGYGANQKSCYKAALDLGADIVVMLHPDYQYSPLLVPALAAMIAYGQYDFVLGSRILAQNSMARGMPAYKYAANRVLTLVREHRAPPEALRVSHGPEGLQQRAAGGPALRSQLGRLRLRQPDHRPGGRFGASIGELSCPTRYARGLLFDQLSARASATALGVLRTTAQYRLHVSGVKRFAFLDFARDECRGRLAHGCAGSVLGATTRATPGRPCVAGGLVASGQTVSTKASVNWLSYKSA